MGFISKLGRRLIFLIIFICSISFGQQTDTQELNQNFLDFWQWYIDYLEYNEYTTLQSVLGQVLQSDFDSNYSAPLNNIQSLLENNVGFNLEDLRNTTENIYYEFENVNEYLQSINDYLNENISYYLYNIDDNSLRSYSKLSEIYDFLSTQNDYESLEQLLQSLSADEITILNNIVGEMGGIYSAIGGVSEAINNINFDVDLQPILDNQEIIIENTLGVSTNVESIAKSISNIESSRIDDNISYLTEQNVGNSQNTIDILTEKFNSSSIYLTNLNASVDLSDYDYDFSQYTNISHQIDVINNDYTLTQTFSKTNDLLTAITDTQKGIDKVANDIKQSFGSRLYNSKITWRLFVENPIEVDLRRYCNYPVDFKKVWDFVLIILTTFSMVYFIRLIWE